MSQQNLLADLRTRAARHRGPIGFRPLPSPEILVTVFVLGTVLAVSPVGREIDRFFHVRLVTRDDGLLYLLLHDGLDRLSSQRVVGVVLALVAIRLTLVARSLTPLVVAGIAQAMFVVTGIVKVLLGKSATALGDPDWWDDGLLRHGKFSMAYPSGHATESVLLWGAVLLLLVMHARRDRDRLLRTGTVLWNLVVVTTVVVSWVMGRHWVSDLGAGLVFGMLGLTLLVGLVERGLPQAVAELVVDRVPELRLAAIARLADQPSRPRIDPRDLPPRDPPHHRLL